VKVQDKAFSFYSFENEVEDKTYKIKIEVATYLQTKL
jgi:hypothetical protein